MATAIPGILARIIDHKRASLAEASRDRAQLERRALERVAERAPARDFKRALTATRLAIIAEMKKASPSKGTFAESFDPASIARSYSSGGASALSVLTDGEFFQGSLRDLETARAAVALPVLRKDFTIDDLHVIEAAAHGADAILLIAAVLDEREMRRFRELAASFGMAALVEVHNAAELDAALESGAEIVGVNNRDLNTFKVTLETSLQLAEKILAGVVKVSESGIHSRADIEKLSDAGYQAFLVGEHLMKSSDPAAALKALHADD
ncbi:MAG: indole-3-glycerol phosphate synthase TrpC [Bryobacteraceae bacterium]